MKEIHLLDKAVHRIHIANEVVPFGRELLCERRYELLLARRYLIVMPVFCKVEQVSAISRHGLYVYLVPNAKISEQASYVAAFLQSSHYMHAGVEDFAKACEALQATAYRRILLENSHFQAFLCEDCTTEKTSKPAAYDEYFSH